MRREKAWGNRHAPMAAVYLGFRHLLEITPPDVLKHEAFEKGLRIQQGAVCGKPRFSHGFARSNFVAGRVPF